MKKTLIIAAAALAGVVLFSLGYWVKYFSGQWHAPRVLVMVNSQQILENELRQEMRFLQVSEGTAFSSITREDVLDRMINDHLILDEARRLKISIPDSAVDGFIAKFWEGYAPEEVNRLLAQQQLKPSDLRSLMHTRMLVEATIKRVVEDPIHVGEDEIEAYYWAHLMQFYRQDRVHARQIVVETKAQAETLLQQLAAGSSTECGARWMPSTRELAFMRGPSLVVVAYEERGDRLVALRETVVATVARNRAPFHQGRRRLLATMSASPSKGRLREPSPAPRRAPRDASRGWRPCPR